MKLYWAPRTRSFRALWMLEEAGCPYDRTVIDIRSGGPKDLEFLQVNPMAKVPALKDGDAMLAESAAICAYIADRHPEAGLAPQIGDPARGRYLHRLFFAAGCIEPAYMQKAMGWTVDSGMAGWGDFDRVIGVLDDAVNAGPWLLGERFSAADVIIGADLHYGMTVFKLVPTRPAFEAYVARCTARQAFQRARAIDEAGA